MRSKFNKIFSETFYNLITLNKNIKNTLPFFQEIEILPLMLCIADFSTMVAHGDRQLITEEFWTFVKSKYDISELQKLTDFFDERAILYARTVNEEEKPLYNWNMGNPIPNNPVSYCCAVFYDIVSSNRNGELLDFTNATQITIAYKNTLEIMVNYYNTIYTEINKELNFSENATQLQSDNTCNDLDSENLINHIKESDNNYNLYMRKKRKHKIIMPIIAIIVILAVIFGISFATAKSRAINTAASFFSNSNIYFLSFEDVYSSTKIYADGFRVSLTGSANYSNTTKEIQFTADVFIPYIGNAKMKKATSGGKKINVGETKTNIVVVKNSSKSNSSNDANVFVINPAQENSNSSPSESSSEKIVFKTISTPSNSSEVSQETINKAVQEALKKIN